MESKELSKDEILHSHPIVSDNKGSDLYVTMEAARKSMDKYADQWKEKYDELKQEVIDFGRRYNSAQATITDQAIQHQKLKDKIEKMEAALKIVRDWKLPTTGKFWDDDMMQPMSYGACYGSNGERDYMKNIANHGLSAWKETKEVERFEGTAIKNPAPGIAICCISPEAKDLLDVIMEKWEGHYKKVKTQTYEPTFYGFAYWLVRWSELIQPNK